MCVFVRFLPVPIDLQQQSFVILLLLQTIVGVLSLTLNLLRDCRMEQEEYRISALAINYFSLGCVSAISVINILIAAFDPTALVG